MSQPQFKPQEWFSTRTSEREDFLGRHGWGGVPLQTVNEDSAFRRYFRLTRAGGQSVILMESVPDTHPNASPGHSQKDFIRLGAYLRGMGLSAPEIYEVDREKGYLLIEDLGDVSFKRAWDEKIATRDELYGLATDTLQVLADKTGRDGNAMGLIDYYSSHVHKNRRRVVDWYIPAIRGQANPDGLAEDYLSVWDAIEDGLPPVPTGFLHIDFHFENLMWMPGRSGVARCGILDFQDAMIGPTAYDLANLLEDARVDVPADMRAVMLDRYTAGMDPAQATLFRTWYRILATQFHCRVIGQFIRLAVRDGKMRYLPMIPRVAGYLRDGLRDPVLAPLARWFSGQGVDFSRMDGFSPDAIRPFIRDDAA